MSPGLAGALYCERVCVASRSRFRSPVIDQAFTVAGQGEEPKNRVIASTRHRIENEDATAGVTPYFIENSKQHDQPGVSPGPSAFGAVGEVSIAVRNGRSRVDLDIVGVKAGGHELLLIRRAEIDARPAGMRRRGEFSAYRFDHFRTDGVVSRSDRRSDRGDYVLRIAPESFDHRPDRMPRNSCRCAAPPGVNRADRAPLGIKKQDRYAIRNQNTQAVVSRI